MGGKIPSSRSYFKSTSANAPTIQSPYHPPPPMYPPSPYYPQQPSSRYGGHHRRGHHHHHHHPPRPSYTQNPGKPQGCCCGGGQLEAMYPQVESKQAGNEYDYEDGFAELTTSCSGCRSSLGLRRITAHLSHIQSNFKNLKNYQNPTQI